jgi:hypothetical protein
MALDPNILLQGRAPNLLQAVAGGVQLGQNIRMQPLREALARQQLETQAAQQQSLMNRQQQIPAGVREFQALTQGLSPEQQRQAQLIELGLEPRAVGAAERIFDIGGVPHKFDPVSGRAVPIEIQGREVTTEDVGVRKKTIAEQVERGRGAGKSASELIDKGFAAITNVQGNIRNLDRALGALDRGARTGAVQRFLPSVTAASKELDQIRNELGLDVVGSVTFGALSESELDLALDTALPTGLDEPALRAWLQRKRDAQTKLLEYYEDQISFIDQGGTVAGFAERNRQARKAAQSPVQNRVEQSLERQTQAETPTQSFEGFEIINIRQE